MRGREIHLENLSDKERGYLFGLFEGDGYKVYDKKSRHYHVEFYLNSIKDKGIIKFMVNLLGNLGLKPNLYQDKRFNCMRVRVYSKFLFQEIKKNISFNNINKDFGLGFVSGLIDSEGWVSKKKHTIRIINTNKSILDSCKGFLDSLDISSSITQRKKSKKDKLDSYLMLVLVNFKRLNHLSIKAGKLQ